MKGPVLPRVFSSTQNPAARRALLAWYRRSARPLPWRRHPSPYEVWVSEVMLQQTQVATVIPYYQRFLQTFPTLQDLARAPLERVLRAWSGMGYYRRARNLHRGAQAALKKFGGAFPANYHQARSLPGVGDYTARAVLSIAYNQPYAVLDGNVARVVARLGAIPGNSSQSEFCRAVVGVLDRLLSRRRPSDFNQAMMEIGQTVCLPRAPRCPACPLRKWCLALRQSRAEAYPEPKPRRRTERHHLATAIIRQGGRVALVRGLDDGLLLDLWNFPSAFGSSRAKALRKLREKLASLTCSPVQMGRSVGEVRHSITFRSLRVHLIPVEVSDGAGSLRWFATNRLPGAALSKLAHKIVERLQEASSS
jgi:A/G-specific adenine glycosylase